MTHLSDFSYVQRGLGVLFLLVWSLWQSRRMDRFRSISWANLRNFTLKSVALILLLLAMVFSVAYDALSSYIKYQEGFVVDEHGVIETAPKSVYSALSTRLLLPTDMMLSLAWSLKNSAVFLLLALYNHVVRSEFKRLDFMGSREFHMYAVYALVSLVLYPVIQLIFLFSFDSPLLSTIMPQFLYAAESIVLEFLFALTNARLKKLIISLDPELGRVAVASKLLYYMDMNRYLMATYALETIGLMPINIAIVAGSKDFFDHRKFWMDVLTAIYSFGLCASFGVIFLSLNADKRHKVVRPTWLIDILRRNMPADADPRKRMLLEAMASGRSGWSTPGSQRSPRDHKRLSSRNTARSNNDHNHINNHNRHHNNDETPGALRTPQASFSLGHNLRQHSRRFSQSRSRHQTAGSMSIGSMNISHDNHKALQSTKHTITSKRGSTGGVGALAEDPDATAAGAAVAAGGKQRRRSRTNSRSSKRSMLLTELPAGLSAAMPLVLGPSKIEYEGHEQQQQQQLQHHHHQQQQQQQRQQPQQQPSDVSERLKHQQVEMRQQSSTSAPDSTTGTPRSGVESASHVAVRSALQEHALRVYSSADASPTIDAQTEASATVEAALPGRITPANGAPLSRQRRSVTTLTRLSKSASGVNLGTPSLSIVPRSLNGAALERRLLFGDDHSKTGILVDGDK